MGDMADFELDNVMDMEELRSDWREGKMSYEDAYNEGIIDELGYEDDESVRNHRQKNVTCNNCGKTRLRWKQVNGKWRLFEKNKPHRCPKI